MSTQTEARAPLVVFTICARNFLAQALTLYESLARTQKNHIFYVCLCDSTDEIEFSTFPFRWLRIEGLGIPKWDWMQKNYNITELNTALKPFAFLLLFDLHPGSPIVYLDPDILVTSRLVELETALDEGAECVLTPHILEPAEFSEFDDQRFLQFGVYNLGFCALRDSPQVKRVVSWWGRRLERKCTIDLANGLFVDQKWADLLPAFIERTKVLRHCGYNVAYWNLPQRKVWREGQRWKANDQDLRFVHFSGSVIGSDTVFSRHSGVFNRNNVGELSSLLAEYERSLAVNGYASYREIPYAFSWGGAAGENLHTPVALARRARVTSGQAMPLPHLPVARLLNREDCLARPDDLLRSRREAERGLLPGSEKPFWVRGFCALCKEPSQFQVGFMFASMRSDDGRLLPNWREHLNCKRCALVNRVRASLHLFLQECVPKSDARIYISERVTPTFRWLNERFTNVVGSEYFGSGNKPGSMVEGVRHEDLQALSFPDDSFDYFLSFDVLEHVPDHTRAFEEAFRCLKPGGTLLFTAPFYSHLNENTVRAVLENDGTIRHVLEPEFHGNPIDPEHGALAYRYFGWNCLRELESIGFGEALALNYWSRDLGYLGEPQFAFIAKKPTASLPAGRAP